MVRGRCAGSTRGATGRRPPCPPGVSYPALASPLGSPARPGDPGAPHPLSPFPAGPTGGPGGPGESGGPGGPAPRGWTLVGPHRRSPGPPECLLIAGCVVCRLGRGVPGVWGVPCRPPCPPLQDVGGRLLVVHRGCSVHRVPRQVFQHCPACVVLVCTQAAFRLLRGPSPRGERHRLLDGALSRWFEGQVGSGTVCGASVRPGAAASRARVAGAGPRPRMASRCTSACNHVCQCVEPIARSGLPRHRRSWKACSQWYTVVATASWTSRSAGCAAAGQNPGLAARALSFSLTRSRRAWCSPSCSALTIMRVRSTTRTTA